MENDENDAEEKITLMTLHAAKGLEFDVVFLPGWEEGLFPHQRSMDEGGVKGLEEERRLAYVGITRARKEARISYAANRRIYNQWQNALPSRFIDELPTENIDADTEMVFYNNSNQQMGGDRIAKGFSLETNHVGGFTDDPSGLTRKRSGYTREGIILEEDAIIVEGSHNSRDYKVGIRVFHQKFGYGKVISSDGNKLEVKFEKSGTKKVIDSFVEPA